MAITPLRPLARGLSVPALIMSLLVSAPALIQPAMAQPAPPMVELVLRAEQWLEASHPRVTVSINAALAEMDAGTMRIRMRDALAQIANKDTPWRFTRFERQTDRAGIESWSAMVEARLPETVLDDIAGRLEQASERGFILRHAGTDFSPSLADTERAKAELRTVLYRDAEAELGRLQDVFGDEDFALGIIEFRDEHGMRRPMAMRAEPQMTTVASVPMADGGGGIAVSRLMSMTALVQFQGEINE